MIVETCKYCSKSILGGKVTLKNCGHEFCKNCFSDFANNMYEKNPYKMQCSYCNVPMIPEDYKLIV
jgi:hypothetical protein